MPEHLTLRILIADDHPMVLDGVRRLIDDQPGMQVVAQASNGAEALRLAEELLPAIAIVDVSMPGTDGLSLTRLTNERCPSVRVIALTRHDDKGFVRNMMQAGAAGYVLKQSSSAELIRAIRSVAGGQSYVDPSVRTAPPEEVRADAPPNAFAMEPLAPIEEQVLRLVAASYSNREIAGRLAVSVDAIATAKTDAMRKLGLTTRLALVRHAQLQGWLLPG